MQHNFNVFYKEFMTELRMFLEKDNIESYSESRVKRLRRNYEDIADSEINFKEVSTFKSEPIIIRTGRSINFKPLQPSSLGYIHTVNNQGRDVFITYYSSTIDGALEELFKKLNLVGEESHVYVRLNINDLGEILQILKTGSPQDKIKAKEELRMGYRFRPTEQSVQQARTSCFN